MNGMRWPKAPMSNLFIELDGCLYDAAAERGSVAGVLRSASAGDQGNMRKRHCDGGLGVSASGLSGQCAAGATIGRQSPLRVNGNRRATMMACRRW